LDDLAEEEGEFIDGGKILQGRKSWVGKSRAEKAVRKSRAEKAV
jgi:hypothetical protein